MASPSEKLAESLEALRKLQQADVVAIRSADLSRTHRERLKKNGFLQEVMKGWYVSAHPDEDRGESTAWYTSFWGFCAAYLNERFGSNWSLSPEQSLFLHTGNWTVPRQLLVRTPKGGNKPTQLPHNTSIFDVRASLPARDQAAVIENLRVFSLPASLTQIGVGMYRENAIEVRTALAMIGDASEILSILLDGGHSTVAGRLAGAFRNIGRDKIADEIIKGMKAADYVVRETDPFAEASMLILAARESSPYVTRIRLMWRDMRESVIETFPAPPKKKIEIEAYLKNVDDIFVADAYHSLSIEGYRVSEALIEKIRDGNWDPQHNEQDRAHRNALAARGYFEAFQAVKESVKKVLQGANAGEVADDDHREWYRRLFTPSITAGILRPSDLAGYRNGPVYIRQSMHVPPPKEAVRDLMPAFFDLLRGEEHPAVRNVLGHFIFVYIHPYFDGNGRMGRFLMNLMMASGGYPWTVIPVEKRDEYMSALEQASVNKNIEPFSTFLARLL
jgi:fido (protein-threonine AMPylation protein)